MKVRRTIAVCLAILTAHSIWAQNNENILSAWDGGSSTDSPETFGWTSSKDDVAWSKQDATSGERFMTNYTKDNYTTEDGSAYTYSATSERSSKLLYLHFASGQTYTYTFSGLRPGHTYRFAGLVGWHNNDETNKVKCTLSIGTADTSYIKIYTEVQVKKKLYPMHATFAVPSNEQCTTFQMVVSNGTATSMLSLSAIALYDLGATTYEPWNLATHLDFDEGVVTKGVYSYLRDRKGDTSQPAQMCDVPGWTFASKTGDACAGAVARYGSSVWVGANNQTQRIPDQAPNTRSNGCALGLSAIWRGCVNYVKPVSFPPGQYVLSALVYNASGTTEMSENRIGFVDEEGHATYASTLKYPVGQWTKETLTLTFDKETRGYLSLGYLATNNGSANVQHLFVDHVSLDDNKSFALRQLDEFEDLNKPYSQDFAQVISTARQGIEACAGDDLTTIDRHLMDVRNAYVLYRYNAVDWHHLDMGDVCLENDHVRNFLTTADYSQLGAASIVSNYATGIYDQPNAVEIHVPESCVPYSSLTLTVSDKDDFSGTDANTRTLSIDPTLAVYNLYNTTPGQTYYYKVETGSDSLLTAGTFHTTGTVRMIASQKGSNIRDLGGRITMDGRRTRYGRLFRGGEMHAGSHTTMSSADLAEMVRLGIKAELDLRSTSDTNGSAPSKSAINGAEYKFIDLVHSSDRICTEQSNRSKVREGIHYIAQKMKAGKPVYFHCIWGADRTGAFGLFLGSILGFTLDDLMKDFEMTSFSKAGLREMNAEKYCVMDKITYCMDNYEGTTPQSCIISFLKDCGVTEADMSAIRNYMLEGDDDTPVVQLKAKADTPRRVYDLSGRATDSTNLRHGICIKDGKKIYVK